ncbi:TPA: hypothetical protein L5U90_003391 [Pseudomonas aeruginosa]|nr:hypothetical protein [Pseudomonas aeruginosa]
MIHRLATAMARTNSYINPVDMPYACMREQGIVEKVIDREGRVLPENWTGLCVSAVSVREFWHIDHLDGARVARYLGRFHRVSDAEQALAA